MDATFMAARRASEGRRKGCREGMRWSGSDVAGGPPSSGQVRGPLHGGPLVGGHPFGWRRAGERRVGRGANQPLAAPPRSGRRGFFARAALPRHAVLLALALVGSACGATAPRQRSAERPIPDWPEDVEDEGAARGESAADWDDGAPSGSRTRRRQRASGRVTGALGRLVWGMEPREVYAHFRRKLEAKYNAQIREAPGAMEEDALRRAKNDAIRELRESYVRFRGERSGWDVSFLRDEFTHQNRESMLVIRDDNSQNFYFFIRGRLWKWYKAFDAAVFEGRSFAEFSEAIQGRFGRAQSHRGGERGRQVRWLEWEDPSTRLRAIDRTRFYGFYCLVFEEKDTLGRLSELRTSTSRSDTPERLVVDSVIQSEGTSEGADANADIVDRITGRVRRRGTGSPAQARPSEERAPTKQRSRPRRGRQRLDIGEL